MQRFFFDDEVITDGEFCVTGEKFNHLVRVLRTEIGEHLIFCDGKYTDNECELVSVDSSTAKLKIIKSYRNETEADVEITVFQCLPKGEKMDDCVKRCVQFGAFEIIPVISKRCVSRPDKKSAVKKVERFNKIARSSAMQSMRGYIPKVTELIDFKQAINALKEFDTFFICYENEKDLTVNGIDLHGKRIAFLVGPEGGLDESEIEYASNNGVDSVSLGKRILRTEDAAPFLIPIIMAKTNNL